MKKVFVTRNILDDGLQLLKQKGFEIEVWNEDRPMTETELMEKSQGANALISMLADPINKNFLEKNSHLKIVCNYAVGTNNIDKEAAARLGIKIGNTPDVLTEATAELALGLMIAASRNFRFAMKKAENGEWKHFEPKGYLGHALHQKVLGVIGMGRIGGRFAEMANSAFNMHVRAYKRGDDLLAFLREVDVLSLHIPLTAENKNFIGKKELAVMKKSAIIINTARGEVIDQDALYEALKNNHIFSAGLDVTTPEPLIPSHPLYALPNVIILPHIGSATYEARRAMSLLCAENIINAF